MLTPRADVSPGTVTHSKGTDSSALSPGLRVPEAPGRSSPSPSTGSFHGLSNNWSKMAPPSPSARERQDTFLYPWWNPGLHPW